MRTNNWKKMMAAGLTGRNIDPRGNIVVNTSGKSDDVTATNIDHANMCFKKAPAVTVGLTSKINGSYGYNRIFVGKSGEPASLEDYTLHDPLPYDSSSLEILSESSACTSDCSKVICSITLYNHGDDVSIKEIGHVCWWAGTSSNTSQGYLIDRTNVNIDFLHDTSITITYIIEA